MKNTVFWDVMPCGCCNNRRIGGRYRFHHQGDKNRSVFRLLVIANVVPIAPILIALMMEVIRSSETFVLSRATRCNIPEDGITAFFIKFVSNYGIQQFKKRN
jgi:hypothetical protein